MAGDDRDDSPPRRSCTNKPCDHVHLRCCSSLSIYLPIPLQLIHFGKFERPITMSEDKKNDEQCEPRIRRSSHRTRPSLTNPLLGRFFSLDSLYHPAPPGQGQSPHPRLRERFTRRPRTIRRTPSVQPERYGRGRSCDLGQRDRQQLGTAQEPGRG